MRNKDVKITYRTWAEMARTDPAILRGLINQDYDEAVMYSLLLSAAGRAINTSRVPMSVDDAILFCSDGRVIITENPEY